MDPVTAELIRNSLQSIVDEMALTLVRTAYSANLKSAMDLSSAICDEHRSTDRAGPDACRFTWDPSRMRWRRCLHRFGGSFRPGDAFVLNDPYDGGTHLPDFFVFEPVFHDDQHIAFAVTVAHHTDVGGRVAGGNGWDSTEIYQEGLRIPPVRLVHRRPDKRRLLALAQRERAHSDESAGRSAGAVGRVPHRRARTAGPGRTLRQRHVATPHSGTC